MPTHAFCSYFFNLSFDFFALCGKESMNYSRWDKLNRANQKTRIERVAKTIDDAPPAEYLHLMMNAKKKQMQTGKKVIIALIETQKLYELKCRTNFF